MCGTTNEALYCTAKEGLSEMGGGGGGGGGGEERWSNGEEGEGGTLEEGGEEGSEGRKKREGRVPEFLNIQLVCAHKCMH